MLLSATAHSIPLNHIIHRKVTKRELNSHDHYVAGYTYFRLPILRTIQFCNIYVRLHCVIVWLACSLVLQFSASYHKYSFRLGILHLAAIRRGITYSARKVFNKLSLGIIHDLLIILFNFNCSSRLHWRSISIFILLMNFCIAVMLFYPYVK